LQEGFFQQQNKGFSGKHCSLILFKTKPKVFQGKPGFLFLTVAKMSNRLFTVIKLVKRNTL